MIANRFSNRSRQAAAAAPTSNSAAPTSELPTQKLFEIERNSVIFSGVCRD
jgi:hypothetical protein